jgi:hypothetical protein
LGIAVHEEGFLFGYGEGGAEVYGRRRFADTALLIGDGNDLPQNAPQSTWAM